MRRRTSHRGSFWSLRADGSGVEVIDNELKSQMVVGVRRGKPDGSF